VTSPDERLDAWIRTRIVELVEASPEPPPFRSAPARAMHHRSPAARVARGFAFACAVALAVILGDMVLGGPSKDVAAAELVRVHAPVGGSVTGRFPRAAVSNGHIDWSKAPRLVAIVNPDGAVLGYMQKSDLDGANRFIGPYDGGTYKPECGSEGIDVYNATRSEVVGAYYPNAGFVPTGARPTCRRAMPLILRP
jgi:hypothetical protein